MNLYYLHIDRTVFELYLPQVSVAKSASTILRMLMTMPGGVEVFRRHDLRSLRLGILGAEPLNEAVHAYAQRHLTPNYVNTYWATEHGGIVWSRCHGNDDQPLQPDARSWPLPWIDAAVLGRPVGVDVVWSEVAHRKVVHHRVDLRRGAWEPEG